MITFLFIFMALIIVYTTLLSYLLYSHVSRYNKEIEGVLKMLTSGAISQVEANKRIATIDTIVKLSLQDDARF